MDIREKIRKIPDYPKPGIVFQDITPLLADAEAFHDVIEYFTDRYLEREIDVVLGLEARGFIFGAALAYSIGAGFIPVRKPGKLPYKTMSAGYTKEYGPDQLEMHVDAIKEGQRVLIVDDLLATGGTAQAACELVESTGGVIVEAAFLMELVDLKGRDVLSVPVHSMIPHP